MNPASPWSSSVVPIVKPDQSIRLCVDYRKLNTVTTPDPYYIPTVDETVSKVRDAAFFAVIKRKQLS